MTLRQAIKRNQAVKGMPNSDRWLSFRFNQVWVPVFPLFLLPETVRDIFLIHDAHHLITGYGTDFRGEMELNAWTLASGGYFFAGAPWWMLFEGDGKGLLIAIFSLIWMPREILSAFRKGWRTAPPNSAQLSHQICHTCRSKLVTGSQELAIGAGDGFMVIHSLHGGEVFAVVRLIAKEA